MTSVLRSLPLLLLLAAACLVAPETVQAREEGVERAEVSQLALVRLPGDARRSTSKPDIAQFESALQKIAETNHGRIGRVEVLIWRGGREAMKQLPGLLKEAGYSYTARPALDAEPGRVTPFGSVRRDNKDDLLGMWIETGNYLLLAWGLYLPDNPDAPGHPAAPGQPVSQAAPVASPEAPPAVQSGAATAAPQQPVSAKPVAAAAKRAVAKPTARTRPPRAQKKAVAAQKRKNSRPLSDAERRNEALRKLKDYNYVKQNFGLGGMTYRSHKW